VKPGFTKCALIFTIEVMMVFSHFGGFPDDWEGEGGRKTSFIIPSQCNVIAKMIALSPAHIRRK
jgi:hypothetical protein